MPKDFEMLGGEPPTSDRFLLEVDGEEIGVFGEVRGLELRIDVHTHVEGGENGYAHQLPGRMTWPPIILRRGITDADNLFEWVAASGGSDFNANGNKVVRRSAAITALGSDGTRLRSWVMQGVMAVRWTGPTFSANSAVVLEEEIELVHHGFVSNTLV